MMYVCTPCRGASIGLSPLKKMIPEKIITSLWVRSRQGGLLKHRACPTCKNLMIEVVAIEEAEHPVHVDVCHHCHLIWFDRHEFEHLPKNETMPDELFVNNQKAREALAMFEVDRIASRARQTQKNDTIRGFLDDSNELPSILGLLIRHINRLL